MLFFPLFSTIDTIRYDRYVPIQTLMITLLRNVMLTMTEELGLSVFLCVGMRKLGLLSQTLSCA